MQNAKYSLQKIEAEILQNLKDWQKLVKNYQQPDQLKAFIQIVNTFLPYLGLWVLMYFSLNWSVVITLCLAVINAFFLVRIFIIQHDCGHQSFLKSKKANNIIGFICSFFSAIPYKYWARVHNYHHGHNGVLENEHRDVGNIPFLTVKEYHKLSKAGKIKYRIFRHPIVLFIFAPLFYFVVSQRYPFFSYKGWEKTRWSQAYNNLWLFLFYSLIIMFLGWKALLLVHLPIVFIFSVIAFWFFYVQHSYEESYNQYKENWNYLLAAIRGSSYYKLPKMFQWLTGNIGFHHIHHLSSRIPNYNLEKCAKENPFLNKYVTKLTFKDSLACMWNKLWDEDLERMISFSTYKKLYLESFARS